MRYTVTALSVGGSQAPGNSPKNKVFKSGDIVEDKDFAPGRAGELEQRGYLKRIDQQEEDLQPQFVDSFNIEFGYELISVLPYAYWLKQKGLLLGTRSGTDTKHLYWFSPDHEENPEPRNWDNMKKAWKAQIPNIHIHKSDLNEKFSPPNLKEAARIKETIWEGFRSSQRASKSIKMDKPVICICNRINVEWEREIINYFDLGSLKQMFNMLIDKYHIIYFNIDGRKEYYDGVEPVAIGDYELAKEMGILTIHDIHAQRSANHPNVSFNETQMQVMAQSTGFITMNGGYSILASYFGGTNIIYSKECQEIKPEINSFYRWYHRFGKSRILHTDNYQDLYKKINTCFLESGPVINILIRTNNRPNYFHDCYKSIENQTYKNINVIAGYHTEETTQYLVPYPVQQLKYNKFTDPQMETPHTRDLHGNIIPDRTNYGSWFPCNIYLNYLIEQVTDGYVIILDDDDAFADPEAVAKIVAKIKDNKRLIMWRLKVVTESGNTRMIPNEYNWKNKPVPRDISMITFCCHHTHLKKHGVEPYRLADFRMISNLYQFLTPVYIDEPLTEMQTGACNFGNGQDKLQTNK